MVFITDTEASIQEAAQLLLHECACRAVVVTLGAKGAYVLSDEGEFNFVYIESVCFPPNLNDAVMGCF